MEALKMELCQKIGSLQSELNRLEGIEQANATAEQRFKKEKENLEAETTKKIEDLTTCIKNLEETEKDHLNQVTQIKEELDISTAKLKDDAKSAEMGFSSKIKDLENDLDHERSINVTLSEKHEETRKEINQLRYECEELSNELSKLRTMNSELIESQPTQPNEQIENNCKLETHWNLQAISPNIEAPEQLSTKDDTIKSLESSLNQRDLQLSAIYEIIKEIFLTEYIPRDSLPIDKLDPVALREVGKSWTERIFAERAEREKLEKALTESQQELKKISLQIVEKERISSPLDSQSSSVDVSISKKEDLLAEANQSIPMVLECKEKNVESDRSTSDMDIELRQRLKEVEAERDAERSRWETKVEEEVRKKEVEMNTKIQDLEFRWEQKRRELERLAQVAANAFKSGTASVDRLKEQVTKQKKEIDEMNKKYKKELEELHRLLELKRRRGRGAHAELNGGGVGGSLEEAAEFEYLKNILYQYMMGTETMTLSKVLCAVVKFNKEEEREIYEQEIKKQNVLREMSSKCNEDTRNET